MKKISIQGIKGAFHEEAAQAYFSEEISIQENLTFEKLIEAVSNKDADMGIMAIENSISGTIHANFELIKNSHLHIVGEIHLHIKQHLAVNKGVSISDLKQVESHYMAINQCRAFFKPYPHIKLVDMEDTALSMRNVSENKLDDTGAIGSRLAADYYNLEIIGESIETDKKNHTRFFILDREPMARLNTNKASIHIVLKNDRGALAKALNIISENDVDVSKIESMPIIGKPWQYQFYLDVIYRSIAEFDRMISALNPHLENLSVLGNYIQQQNKELNT